MPKADFFHQFGLLIVPEFLDGDLCASLRAEVRQAQSAPAPVARRGGNAVDETSRRARWAHPSAASTRLVRDRILSMKPVVERHFGMPLLDCQALQFTCYQAGGFHNPHRDCPSGVEFGESATGRKVGAILFLTGEGEEASEDTYVGGALTFYGLLPEPPLDQVGFPLAAAPGLLVGFRADLMHEVRPVLAGERLTIVTFYI